MFRITKSTKVKLNGSIVIVDSDTDMLHSTVEMLKVEFAPARVVGTTDPWHAMVLIDLERPAVLIADIQMPEAGGLELIMYAQKRWRNIPVIAMTGSANTAMAAYSRFSGFAYLQKPVSLATLSQVIANLSELPAAAFRGSGATTNLADVVQLCALSTLPGVLAVEFGNALGEIWMDQGRAVHAATGEWTGANAFFKIMSWPHGTLSWLSWRPTQITLQDSLTKLLLEAYRIQDEQASRLQSQGIEADLPEQAKPPSQEAELPSEDAEETELSREGGNTMPGYPWHRRGLAGIAEIDSREFLSPLPGREIDTMNWADDGLTVDIDASEISDIRLNNDGVTENDPQPTRSYRAVTKEMQMALSSNNIKENLLKLEGIEGFIGAAIADSDSGMCLGFLGGAGVLNMELAAASNAEVVRSKRKAMKALGLRDDVEDILITLGKQYHLIRPVKARPNVFFYCALDRQRSNLAMARYALADAERELTL